MKPIKAICVLLIIWSAAYRFAEAADNDASPPEVRLSLPYSAKIGEPFVVDVRIEPPAKRTIQVKFITNGNISFTPKATLDIPPGSKQQITLKALSGSPDGIPYIEAHADGYTTGSAWIDLGFQGHVKANSIGKLPYGTWSAVTLALVDKDGKPFSATVPLKAHIQSTDAALKTDKEEGNDITLMLLRNANFSPPFEVRPLDVKGAEVHLTTTLTQSDIPEYSLDTQYVALQADPAWWLPLLLAVGGGLMYGLYQALDFAKWPKEKVGIAITAALFTSTSTR